MMLLIDGEADFNVIDGDGRSPLRMVCNIVSLRRVVGHEETLDPIRMLYWTTTISVQKF
jgi:hypothetical protein